MNILYYNNVDSTPLETILKDVETYRPSKVVFFCETEWYHGDLNEEMAEVMNKHNVEVIITLCSFPNEFYNDQTKHFNNVKIDYWPTFWAHWTLMCGSRLNFKVNYTNFEHPFICLNNRNHLHRCILIDEIARNNLIEKGVVTWNRFPNKTPSDSIYKMKYYDDNFLYLKDDFQTKLDSFLIPAEYHNSFLHVIGEATTSVTCISEKTWLPILFKKPWIILSNQGFHKDLQSLGFELYDEILDYSFDSEPDLNKRAYLISENVKRICNSNHNNLYPLIKDKTIRNYYRFIQIIQDSSLVPEIIKDRITLLNRNPNLPTQYTDPRYMHIAKTTGIL